MVVAHLNAAMEGAETHDDDSAREQIVLRSLRAGRPLAVMRSAARSGCRFLELEATVRGLVGGSLRVTGSFAQARGRLVRRAR